MHSLKLYCDNENYKGGIFVAFGSLFFSPGYTLESSDKLLESTSAQDALFDFFPPLIFFVV